MAQKPNTQEELDAAVAAYVRYGTERIAAKALGWPPATMHNRLEAARRRGMTIPDKNATPSAKGRIEIEIVNGCGIVGSDAHYWPGDPSTAHRAFCHLAKELKPEFVVLNGDAMDLSRISRHPPPGWTRMPETRDELEATAERMRELSMAAGKAAKYWPWGNHDQRWEVYLASNAPEMAGVLGMRLCDHFPEWEPCWSVFVNNRPGGLVIKHRFKGGIHAPHNNAITAGRSIATGHLHSQKITPITDYNGTRYGVDVGCIADIYAPQFAYLEDSPRNWRSGLAVFTWDNGTMLPPELVTVIEPGIVAFRGQQIIV